MRQPDEELATKWAIRLTPFARADIAAAWNHFSQSSGEEVADSWQQGLESELMRLTLFPASLPVADEDGSFQPPFINFSTAEPSAAPLTKYFLHGEHHLMMHLPF